MNALIKIARAYNNFIAYLRDDTVEIDAEYLWDLICKPNPKIFPNGMNMVILELSRKDVTDNVEILCPSNHYSTSFFDVKKRTFLILKIENFYEPIYSYESRKEEINIQRYFSIMNNELLPNVKHTLKLINQVLAAKCAPLPSLPTIYNFEKNITLERLVSILNSSAFSGFVIDKHVKNYDNKIIGVVAINNKYNTKGFIPCYPSAPARAATTEIVWMENVYTDTYEHTRDFLTAVYKKSRREIPCKPYIKVMEDGLIVGILTKTNQFVLISDPVQDTFGDDLKKTDGSNYAEADRTIGTSDAVDDNRVNFIKKIQLETNFYNVFRNTARYLLGKYENSDMRHEIEEKINSTQLYLKKLHSVETLLRDLMGTHVMFHKYEETALLKLNNITSCYNNCENKDYCSAKNENGECALMIPDTNLINQKSNDTFYYGKLADEVIRYSRIKMFIFNPKTVLSFSNLKYNLRENEIILLQSLLTKEYFENVTLAKSNQYITYNTYDTTQPLKAQNYSNSDTLENLEKKEALTMKKMEPIPSDNCTVITKKKISHKFFYDLFPKNSKEAIYQPDNNACYFKPILTILREDDNDKHKDLTTNELKEKLAEEYRKYYDKYKAKIMNIFRAQGKKELPALIESRKLNFYDMLISEDYYPTNLDFWLLAIHYDIPLVFLSETALMENNNKIMVAHSNGGDSYYFLKVSASSTHVDKALLYTLIRTEDGSASIDINDLRDETVQAEIRGAVTENNVLQFIANFSLTETHKQRITVKRKIVAPAPAAEPSLPEQVPEPAAEPSLPAPAAEPSLPAPAVKNLKRKLKIRENPVTEV